MLAPQIDANEIYMCKKGFHKIKSVKTLSTQFIFSLNVFLQDVKTYGNERMKTNYLGLLTMYNIEYINLFFTPTNFSDHLP